MIKRTKRKVIASIRHQPPLSTLPKLIAIVGPTASGKTVCALDLARECNAEIISADSRQVYRGMDIGTSKPHGVWEGGQYVVENIPYHLVDIVDPDEEFTLAHYQQRAFETIDTILARGVLPLLVGGTGLYIQAVVDNLSIPAVEPNAALRKRLAQKSTAELASILKAVTPAEVIPIDQRNPRRLIRAIEIALAAPAASTRIQRASRYATLQIGIAKPKEELSAAIDARVDEMVEAGLVHEVETLLANYPRTLPAFSGIGYAEIAQYLDGMITLEKATRLIKTHTRQYARRQMTWFKRDKRIHWVSALEDARELCAGFLK
ncbi:tRNA (adenosine(37)-N6)-dimethylallyltransferase MiaA [Candidatus Parcubacteria bacterium]|nr:tRNA (adenosine(37)-N6)-dimethylallyltransferase MiaA [Candidatus Parcubacteria bacterium]